MKPLSGPTGVHYTGVATSPNLAYEMMKREREMDHSYEYDLVGQSHPPVEPSRQFQGEGEGYVVPNLPAVSTHPAAPGPLAMCQEREKGYVNLSNLPKPSPTASAVPPSAVAPSHDRKAEEAVYEPIPGD